MIFAIGLVLLSGLVHSIWILFTKNSNNKIVFLWYCQIAAIIIFLPFVLVELDRLQNIPRIGWGLIVISMILHGLYVLLLARTYSIGDLSQAYPIMRGTSPLLVPLIGVTFLHEQLTLMGRVGLGWGGDHCSRDHDHWKLRINDFVVLKGWRVCS